MTKKILLSIFIVVVINEGCVEVNTVTPQASQSVLSSKQSGFYQSGAHKLYFGVLDIIESVWVERNWRYDVANLKKKKIPLTGSQIILKIKDLPKDFQKSDYLLNWSIKEKHLGNLASGNGVFILDYSRNEAVDTLSFQIHVVTKDSLIDIGTFILQ